MFDIPVSKMNDKQLRNAVQWLYDELAIFKRKYNDAIYNLDSENLGKSFTVTQNNMKTQLKIAADAIKSAVTEEDLVSELTNYSTISQTAQQIETAVESVSDDTDNKLRNYSTISQTAQQIETAVVSINNATDNKLKNYSTVEQTAQQIASTVTSEYVTELIGDDLVTNATLQSSIAQSASEIYAEVSSVYEKQDDAEAAYDNLNSSISRISVKADSVSSRVTNLETFQESTFTQTAYGFTLDGEQTTFTGVIYLTDEDNNKRFSFFFDPGSQGYEQVFLRNCDGSIVRPLVLGDSDGQVYIQSAADGNQVATRNWVLAQDFSTGGTGGTAVAVFG